MNSRCIRHGWSICFFKQKTAYEMRISDWSSDVCSSDLVSFAQNEGEATVTIESVSDGETREIHALYVVGCDGAWSPVREAMGRKFEDLAFDEPCLVVDALVGDGVRLPATRSAGRSVGHEWVRTFRPRAVADT